MVKVQIENIEEGSFGLASRTWTLFKGKALLFLDCNHDGQDFTIFTGKTKEECFAKAEGGSCMGHSYDDGYDPDEDDNEANYNRAWKKTYAWMVKQDNKAIAKEKLAKAKAKAKATKAKATKAKAKKKK